MIRLKFLDWLLVFLLLFSAIYNAQNTYVRLAVVFALFFLPFVFFLNGKINGCGKNVKPIIWASIFWVVYVVIWLSVNLENISLDFSGPNVEMFTPVLFITALYTVPLIENYNKERLEQVVTTFIKFYFIFLIIDLIWRFLAEPTCFMNYECRFEAKTVGYFSTTNALGTSLAVVILSLQASGNKMKMLKKLLIIILITTMARAAIIAALFVFLILKAIKAKKKIGNLIIIFGVILIILNVVYDPFGLQNDGSGLSKIDFFMAGFNLMQSMNIYNVLFGFGANFMVVTSILGVNDWSPHAPILKALLYFGVAGVLLHVYYLYSVVKLHKQMIFPVVTFIILSLAGAPLYFPTFLCCFAILRSIERK